MRSLLLLAALLQAGAAPAQQTHLLIVSGIGGEPEFSDLFHRWSATMVDVARGQLGLPAERVTYLAEAPERDAERIDGPARKSTVLDAIARIARESRPGDTVLVLLVGHGTARDERALFNLPGPDLSAEELASALDAAADRQLVVVNTSPASAAFLPQLSRPGRVVITATASAAETDHTHFAGQFVAAFVDAAGDTDKDGRVSVLEAFEHARREVRRAYELDRRLLTEHPLLDDDGDAAGTLEPAASTADGALAKRVYLLGAAAATTPRSPRELALEAEARALVKAVESLKRRRIGIEREAYERKLEALLVYLALNRRALREALQ